MRELQAIALRRARRQPVPVSDGLVLIGLDDRYVAVPSSDHALIALLIEEPVYEPGVSAVLGQLADDKACIIDVGANIGLHTISMARAMRRDGKLLALEPTPQTFRALHASLVLNGLMTKVDARQVAAGAGAGDMTLHCHPVSGQNSLFDYPEIETHPISVSVAPLDDLVPEGTRVDLVKIDAEGAEFEILKGMKRILAEAPDIAVVLEFSATHFERAGTAPAELVSFMAGLGFGARRIDDASGRLEVFDLDSVLALPAANVLFRRETAAPAGAMPGRSQI